MPRQDRPIHPVLRAREKIVLHTAKQIADWLFRNHHLLVDEKVIESIVRIHLPLTHAEAEAEYDRTPNEKPRRVVRKPSVMDELRDALGLGREVPLVGVIRSAADFVRERKACEAEEERCKSKRLTGPSSAGSSPPASSPPPS